ncbi:YicC/YloC family endoribonuclease [Aureibacter tunicatorum]|uniref:Uncharacterized protein (TIGR00255 family) n=1 Tax=Aureibacter tunicatorum TaxID=866807 RepID=A0AAE4BNW3_9BACT|nr:YicC/YloC family endoribonuclease [Aureibacter tunicatorum]MDR6237279.1 uncharacterized protein (TIGR00255 family) [Aureibacter tunicatorum]BDD06270.1 hypothetical protein AUTU_37530 [Aureibacter tunicatorum]
MIKSMTGYGTAQFENENCSVSVEIKSLNSKYLDANIKLPRIFMEKEIEVRNLLSEKLERGKIALIIDFSKKEDDTPRVEINDALFRKYYGDLERLADDVDAPKQELFKLAFQMPEVAVSKKDDGNAELWQNIRSAVIEAVGKCDEFRRHEGQTLAVKLTEYKDNIGALLEKVLTYEDERIETVKARISQNLTELKGRADVDQNRFEQELIYYIEKLDISEEKVRLRSHLDYLDQVLDAPKSNGKKIGFIGQEIGREINTIGSKANHSEIQRIVVQMKDELEKIKEQALNVL